METKSEFHNQMLEIFDDECDAVAMTAAERPNLKERTWNGFQLAYVVDWTLKYHIRLPYDWISKSVESRSNLPEDGIQEAAVKNLKRLSKNERPRPMELEIGRTGRGTFVVGSMYYPEANWICSLIMSIDALENWLTLCGEREMIILPSWRERLYFTGIRAMESPKLAERRLRTIADTCGYRGSMFTDKAFRFRKGMPGVELVCRG